MFRNRLPLAVLVALAACKPAEETEDPAAHACEQVGKPGTAVDASSELDGAPSITLSETPYTVALVDGAPGYVAVDVTEDAAALLFAGTADVVSGLWLDGVEQSLPTGAPNEDCPEDIPEHFDLDLAPGTWGIALGPAVIDSVWLVLIGSEGHAHAE